MTFSLRWTTNDLEAFPVPLDDTRYEIIDGELYVAHQPSLEHQYACTKLSVALEVWSEKTEQGLVFGAPGVIFAEDDQVAPDVVWISRQRLRDTVGRDGKLHGPPELVVEVLSPGVFKERRDRDAKLGLRVQCQSTTLAAAETCTNTGCGDRRNQLSVVVAAAWPRTRANLSARLQLHETVVA